MKKTNKPYLIYAATALWSVISVTSVLAQSTVRNGGESAELRFNAARTDLTTWIKSSGLKEVDLIGASSEKTSETLLEAIATTKIEFSEDPIHLNGASRCCINFPTQKRIQCSAGCIENTAYENLLALVFHEYLGVIGLEPNTRDKSDYRISQQIYGFIEDKIVLNPVLPPMPRLPIELGGGWFFSCVNLENGKKEVSKKIYISNETMKLQSLYVHGFQEIYQKDSRIKSTENKLFGLAATWDENIHHFKLIWISMFNTSFDGEHNIILNYDKDTIVFTGDKLSEQSHFKCTMKRIK